MLQTNPPGSGCIPMALLLFFFCEKNYESSASTKAGNFLVRYVTINFSRKVWCHGMSCLYREITMTCAKVKIIHSNREE
jgi:hypothetical protein